MHLIKKKSCTRCLTAALLLLAGSLAACDEPASEPVAEAPAQTLAPVESTCGNSGRLTATLIGAINIQVEWPDAKLHCESMPRPDAKGVRLRFSGEISEQRLAIIIALPDLAASATGDGFDSNVTITVESSARFFSTPNLHTCWTDITRNELLPGEAAAYNVVGSLSCVGPLGEINSDAFVDVRDLRFSGVANWSKP